MDWAQTASQLGGLVVSAAALLVAARALRVAADDRKTAFGARIFDAQVTAYGQMNAAAVEVVAAIARGDAERSREALYTLYSANRQAGPVIGPGTFEVMTAWVSDVKAILDEKPPYPKARREELLDRYFLVVLARMRKDLRTEELSDRVARLIAAS